MNNSFRCDKFYFSNLANLIFFWNIDEVVSLIVSIYEERQIQYFIIY